MEIVLSTGLRRTFAEDAADIRIFAEGCESLPYTTYRENVERATYIKFLKRAKNVAVYLECLSKIRGDVSFLLPALKVEIRRALARCEYMPEGGLAGTLRSRLLHVWEDLTALDEGAR